MYRFSDLKLLDQINTLSNPKGLVALCPDAASTVLACPGISRGHVRVELYNIRKSTIIPAHETDLACLALSQDGRRLATASDRGTLVRVFDTHSAAMLHELRRGADRAEIYSIAFDRSANLLACSSDKGTVHIFSLRAEGEGPPPSEAGPEGPGSSPREPEAEAKEDGAQRNATSGLGFLRSVVPSIMPKYFASEWSFAQVRGLEGPTICAFGHAPNTIVVVGADGTFLQSSFAEGGECERVAYARFLRREDDVADDLLVRETPPLPQPPDIAEEHPAAPEHSAAGEGPPEGEAGAEEAGEAGQA